MTLIEIIKTSLLGFSVLFIFLWIFFYLFLKFKKSNNKVVEDNQLNIPVRLMDRPAVQSSPVVVQPVINQSINQVRYNNSNYNNRRNQYNPYNENRRASANPNVKRSDRYVVFNKNQFGFNYNL